MQQQGHVPPGRAKLDAACRLEAIDDILLRIFRAAAFSPVEQLRFSLVSKKWHGLLLRDVTLRDCQSSAGLVAWAGSSLLKLDVSALEDEIGPCFPTGGNDRSRAEILGSCPNLQTLIMWRSRGGADGFRHAGLEATHARRLIRLCPRLDGSCRLLLAADSVDQAVGTLDELPGRHAVIFANYEDISIPALNQLLVHERLGSLTLWCEGTWGEDASLDTILAAFKHAASASPGQPACSLERLHVYDNVPSSLDPLAADAVRTARARAAEHGPLYSGLQELVLVGCCSERATDVELLAALAPGSLRHLTLASTTPLTSPAALAALLEPFQSQLASLSLEGQNVPCGGAAALLAAPECRLRSLTATATGRFDGGDGVNPPALNVLSLIPGGASAFCEALAANASLRRLRLRGCGPTKAVLVANALASRAAGPLRHLDAGGQGCDIGPAGAVALSASACTISLIVQSTCLDAACLQALAVGLRSGRCILQELDITNAGFDDGLEARTEASAVQAACALLGAVAASTTLRRFVWSDPRFDHTADLIPGCAAAVSGVLRENRMLQSLDLSALALSVGDRRVSLKEAEAVGDALSANTTLRFLALGGLSEADNAAVVRGLRGNTALRSLALIGGSLDGTSAGLLAIALTALPPTSPLRRLALGVYSDTRDEPTSSLTTPALAVLATMGLRGAPQLALTVWRDNGAATQHPHTAVAARLEMAGLIGELSVALRERVTVEIMVSGCSDSLASFRAECEAATGVETMGDEGWGGVEEEYASS